MAGNSFPATERISGGDIKALSPQAVDTSTLGSYCKRSVFASITLLSLEPQMKDGSYSCRDTAIEFFLSRLRQTATHHHFS